jgi:hypothetical protein
VYRVKAGLNALTSGSSEYDSITTGSCAISPYVVSALDPSDPGPAIARSSHVEALR